MLLQHHRRHGQRPVTGPPFARFPSCIPSVSQLSRGERRFPHLIAPLAAFNAKWGFYTSCSLDEIISASKLREYASWVRQNEYTRETKRLPPTPRCLPPTTSDLVIRLRARNPGLFFFFTNVSSMGMPVRHDIIVTVLYARRTVFSESPLPWYQAMPKWKQ